MMTKLKLWVIGKLAGDMPIMLNMEIDGCIPPQYQMSKKGGMVKNCKIAGHEKSDAITAQVFSLPGLT